jgi:phosphotransferase system  glucose/maltose/N-acetylglucosamine-specific IIC component
MVLFSEIREHQTFVVLLDWWLYVFAAIFMLTPVFIWGRVWLTKRWGHVWLTRRQEQLKGAGGLLLGLVLSLVVPIGVGIVISAWFQSTVADSGYAYCLQTP